MKKITVIDYGLGNIHSIVNMVEKIGGIGEIGDTYGKIENAERIILPGVGAFDHGMTLLRKKGLLPILQKKAIEQKIPLLGICLGAQLLTEKSEEGSLKGIGWIHGSVKKFVFDASQHIKVPHVGWNVINIKKKCSLMKHIKDGSRYYFTHSYYIDITKKEYVVATTEYGMEFVSIFNKDNIYGVQFHPEKSHAFGMALIKNFLTL